MLRMHQHLQILAVVIVVAVVLPARDPGLDQMLADVGVDRQHGQVGEQQALGLFQSIDYPGLPKPAPVGRVPLEMSETKGAIRHRAPLLGEHNQEIYAALGLQKQGKALFYRQLEKGIDAAYVDAAQTMACNMMDEAALEGVQAFIDKRKPNWD